MSTELSVLLENPPSLLSTASMISDDREATIREITRAERKSPAVYALARDLFVSVLQGDFTFDEAMTQAGNVADSSLERHTKDVLRTAERFLREEPSARVTKLGPMSYSLPNGSNIVVSPVWVRHLHPDRLMVLHFWKKQLTQRQLGAFSASLKATLALYQEHYVSCGIDFISVAKPEHSAGRRFQRYGWKCLDPLSEGDLDRFWKQFLEAWETYKRRGPRRIKTRRDQGSFGWG